MSADINWYRDDEFFRNHPELLTDKTFQDYLKEDGGKIKALFESKGFNAIYGDHWPQYEKDIKRLSVAFPSIIFKFKCVDNTGSRPKVSNVYARGGWIQEYFVKRDFPAVSDFFIEKGDDRYTVILYHTISYQSIPVADISIDDKAKQQIKDAIYAGSDLWGEAQGETTRFRWCICKDF